MTIKAQVNRVLNMHPETKSDDRELIITIFKDQGLVELLGKRAYDDWEKFYRNAPCVETLRRTRQKILQERKSGSF